MTATPPRWRVAIRKGDVLDGLGTYDSSAPRGTSRWRSCRWRSRRAAGGADPFTTNVDVKGVLTHGHLPENDTHGGASGAPRNPLRLPDGPRTGTVDISSFLYGQGDLWRPGAAGAAAVRRAGR